jgi:ankyrin repeat protein
MLAILEGCYECTKELLIYSNLTLCNNNKQNIFHLCSYGKNPKTIKLFNFFLKQQILNDMDIYGNTPLKCSIINNNFEVFKVLCEFGCDINMKDLNKDRPVFFCIKNEYFAFAKYLIDIGANTQSKKSERKKLLSKFFSLKFSSSSSNNSLNEFDIKF